MYNLPTVWSNPVLAGSVRCFQFWILFAFLFDTMECFTTKGLETWSVKDVEDVISFEGDIIT